MAENTKIEWADHTFNPWGPGAERRRTSESNWGQPIKWNAEAERLGGRYRVFCASLADVFDNEVPVQWRRDLFDMIAITPHLDWLLVTKRIGNAKTMMADALHLNPSALSDGRIWPLPNVWLGITVVNQDEADRDIPKLLSTPAAVRFLSMEPLLGPVSLRWISAWPENKPLTAQNPSGVTDHLDGLRRLDWIIVGGESGSKARPMHPQWARDLRDQCETAGVPFLFKQWGEWAIASHENGHFDGDMVRNSAHWIDSGGQMHKPSSLDLDSPIAMFRAGKKAAGRLLDGREHNGFPSGFTN